MVLPDNPEQKIALKQSLKAFCLQSIEARMEVARTAMDAAQEAANAEEKSSAGDKYETARAMSHLQKDMQAKQLGAYMSELAALHTVNTNRIYDRVTTGCLARSGTSCYFVGAGLGKQIIEGNTIVFLSPNAPLARAMWGRQEEETYVFNGAELRIDLVF